MHGARLAEDVAKVKLVMVVPEYRYAIPPFNLRAQRRRRFAPWGLHLMAYEMAEEPDSSWGGLPSAKKSTGATSPIIRPKIASADDTLKETAVAAPTTLKEPAVAAATRKEPTIAATTTRHKQLRPGNPAQVKLLPFSALTRCVRRSSGSHPNQPQQPQKHHQHQAPPSAPPAPPVGQVKKGRKRGAKKGASSSQPAPKRIRADDMVPPTPDGLPRCHEAGKPILPPDMEHLASGPMLPLQHSINYLESVLLKEKDPNYPVFSVKVPSDQNFVNEDPADIFFIAFEDVFNLFHSKRLDYNLVRLYAINLQMKINRERPGHIAVADPYYMRDSQLQDGSRTRTKAVRYLQNFMLMYKESNTILLPVFPEDKYCTLIILDPKWSLAQYFDSSSTTTKKDYNRIRGVLDEAILGYSKNGGTFDKNGQYIRPDTKKIGFKHVINFPCIKQPAGSIKEAFYVLHHLKGFVEDAEMMSLPPKMTYYVVFEGRVPGVYEEWEECKKQVHKFSGNCYQGYPTRHEAVAKWRKHQSNKSKMKMKTFLVLSLLLTIVAAVLYFILVCCAALHPSTNNLHVAFISYWFDKPGFLSEENLPPCSSYLTLGVTIARLRAKIVSLEATVKAQEDQLRELEEEGEDIQGGAAFLSDDDDFEEDENTDVEDYEFMEAGEDDFIPIDVDDEE
ncbi:hypothetical protein QYE76_035459 [Lolium multiflorum]|uniref:Ribonuclease H1 N-terminal domain-containing protein n=1 Tax=Lolium multiflorum TaxID=4521 RepID=A0AAD8R0Y6_LOLMU|nr:hypothetical protein QYE76_035459 [Lolium multiflorum]